MQGKLIRSHHMAWFRAIGSNNDQIDTQHDKMQLQIIWTILLTWQRKPFLSSPAKTRAYILLELALNTAHHSKRTTFEVFFREIAELERIKFHFFSIYSRRNKYRIQKKKQEKILRYFFFFLPCSSDNYLCSRNPTLLPNRTAKKASITYWVG